MNSKLDLKNHKADLAVAGLLIFILFGIGAIYLIAKGIVADNKLLSETNLNIEEQYLRRDRYETLLSDYQKIVKDNILTDVKNILPSADSFLSVVEEMESLAKKSGGQIVMNLGETRLTSGGFEIDLQKVKNQSSIGSILPPEANYDFIEIEASLRGNYNVLKQFLSLFKQAKYYMNIVSITVNRVENSDKGVDIDTHLTIQIYVQKVIRTTGS